jgi:2-aminoadipate transaminase
MPGAHGTSETAGRVDFGQGLPDLDLVPAEDLRRCFDAVLAEGGRHAFGYFGAGGPAEMRVGCFELRRAVADLLSERDGWDGGPDGVLLVHGSTDGLADVVDAFAGPGRGAVVEETTFHHVPRFLRRAGAPVATARVDAGGVDTDAVGRALEQLAGAGTPAGLIYTIPSFHSPTGTVLGLDRRRHLLRLAADHGAVVVEDACYHDLHFGTPPPPTLLALDEAGTVVQSGTFSKLLAPGLRLGWLAGPPELVERLAATRRDFSVNRMAALAVARYLDEGRLWPHVERLRAAYREKQDVAVAALARHAAGLVDFDVPTGGFYLWLRLSPGVDPGAVGRLAAARGLTLRLGDAFGGEGTYPVAAVRLSVAQVPLADIEPGIASLGQVLAEAAAG